MCTEVPRPMQTEDEFLFCFQKHVKYFPSHWILNGHTLFQVLSKYFFSFTLEIRTNRCYETCVKKKKKT